MSDSQLITKEQATFTGIDFTSPLLKEDPARFWHEVHLAAGKPIIYSPVLKSWVALGHGACTEAFKDAGLFARNPMPKALADRIAAALPEAQRANAIKLIYLIHDVQSDWLLLLPGDKHRVLRSAMSGWFTPTNLSNFRTQLKQIVEWVVANTVKPNGATFDYAKDISAMIPPQVLSFLLGIPVGDIDKFAEMAIHYLDSSDPVKLQSGEPHHFIALGKTTEEILRFATDLVESKRDKAKRGHDLVSHLLDLKDKGVDITEEMIIRNILMIIVGGYETTKHGISEATRRLLLNPALSKRLRENPDEAGAITAEILRRHPVVINVTRNAQRNGEFMGHEITAGDGMMMSVAAANLDPSVFPDPLTINPNRPNIKDRLTFGDSIHICLGLPLADAEIEFAAVTTVATYPDLTFALDQLPTGTGMLTTNIILTMPVQYGPRSVL